MTIIAIIIIFLMAIIAGLTDTGDGITIDEEEAHDFSFNPYSTIEDQFDE